MRTQWHEYIIILVLVGLAVMTLGSFLFQSGIVQALASLLQLLP